MAENIAAQQEATKRSLRQLLGIMALVALAEAIASIPTCGFSIILGGAIGAFVWVRLEQPPRESIMKRSATAGAVAGGFLGIIGGVGMLFAPEARVHPGQWAAMIAVICLGMALISALTGLLGGAIYKARTTPKAAGPVETEVAPAAPRARAVRKAAPSATRADARTTTKRREATQTVGARQPVPAPAVTRPEPSIEPLIDLSDTQEGELLPLTDEKQWDHEVVGRLSVQSDRLWVILVRSQLDVMLLNAYIKMHADLHAMGVTAIGYDTDDRENATLLAQGNRILLVPKDVAYHRPLCFEVPDQVTQIEFMILRHSKDSIRIVRRTKESQQFRLKIRIE